MEDAAIVELYWQRDQQAIRETEAKYGAYCRHIAHNILENGEDAEECLSDTWLSAWQSIPPHRPERLSTFLGKLTRNLSLSRLRERNAQKRGGGEAEAALEELSECIAAREDAQDALEARELGRLLRDFAARLGKTERDVFVSRYYFLASLEELSRRTGFSQSKLKSMLFRTRKKLKRVLEEEGYR